MYLNDFITPCDSCYHYALPACPVSDDYITVKGGLPPEEDIWWFLEDKFGKVWSGAITTDAEGDALVPLDEFPAGYFTQNDGQFALYFKPTETYSSLLPLTFDTVEYECIRLTFQDVNSDNYTIQ